jgi:DNA-binding IclR family transcriptional regulator
MRVLTELPSVTTAAAKSPVNQSIERAAKLLGLFSAADPELSLAQMATRLGVSRATAHRYATALRNAGLLRMTSAGWGLGPRVIELASTAIAGLRVVAIAEPFLRRLVAETDETAVLSVWDGEAPIVVRVDDNTNRVVRINVRTGSSLERDSAQAKVFRAYPPIADPGLAGVAAEGLAFSASSIDGIAAMAAPVFQADRLVAALALVGTLSSIRSELGSPVADTLRAVAAGLSAELGHLQRPPSIAPDTEGRP